MFDCLLQLSKLKIFTTTKLKIFSKKLYGLLVIAFMIFFRAVIAFMITD